MGDREEVTVSYEEPVERPTVCANGAQGAPTPDGAAVVLHLYSESFTLPSMVQVPLENGRPDFESQKEIKRSGLTREVQATLFLPPESAIRIGMLMVRLGKAAQKSRTTATADLKETDDDA